MAALTRILGLTIIFTALPATFARLPGDTITNGKGTTLQPNVIEKIVATEHALAPTCKHPRIVQTAVVGESRRLGLRINEWTERWTVERCGTRVFYVIHFDFRGSVGTFKIEGPSPKPK